MTPDVIIAAAFGLGFTLVVAAFAIGTTIGDGIVSAKAVEAIARQPEARANIFQFLIIGVGFVEGNAFIALGLALYLFFGVARVQDIVPKLLGGH